MANDPVLCLLLVQRPWKAPKLADNFMISHCHINILGNVAFLLALLMLSPCFLRALAGPFSNPSSCSVKVLTPHTSLCLHQPLGSTKKLSKLCGNDVVTAATCPT